MSTQPLPPVLDRVLTAFRRRSLAIAVLRLAAIVLTVQGAAAFVAMQVDHVVFLDRSGRLLVTAVAHGLTLIVLAAGVLRLRRRRLGPVDLAYALERRLPQAEERFVTLAALGGETSSDVRGDLIAQLSAEVESAGGTLRAEALVDHRPIVRAVLPLLATLLALGGLGLIPGYDLSLSLRRYLNPTANLPKPSFLSLTLHPGDVRIGAGGEVVIEVEVGGRIPPALAWIYAHLGMSPNVCLVATAANDPVIDDHAEALARVQRQRFVWSRAAVEDDLAFRIRCGDAETAVHRISVVRQPRILSVEVAVTPPAYSGLPAEVLVPGDEPLRILAGSQAILRFRVDRPVPRREIRVAGMSDPIAAEWDEAALSASWSFTVDRDRQIEATVIDAEGFANREPQRLTISRRPDAEPTMTLDEPRGTVQAMSGSLLTLRGRAQDDLGIQSAVVSVQINPHLDADAPVQDLPIDLGRGSGSSLDVSAALDLERCGAVPGDEMVVQVRIRDSADQDGLSSPVLIQVISASRGEGEARRLRVLRLVAEALAGLDETNAWSDDLAAGLTRRAQALGLTETGTLQASDLITILEGEHLLTASPRDRADVRMLALLIHDVLQAGVGRPADLVAPIQALITGRSLPNLITRIHGLRNEVGVIANDIAALRAAGEKAEGFAETRSALIRRGKLFQEQLEDVGVEILNMARATQTLDSQDIEKRIADLNASASQFSRAGNSRSVEAAAAIPVALTDLMRRLIVLAPSALKDARVQAAALASLEHQRLAALVKDAHPTTDARRLLALRLLDREPFAALAERAILVGIASAPDPGVAGAIVEQRVALKADEAGLMDLALAWEGAALRQWPRIATADLACALALLDHAYGLPEALPAAALVDLVDASDVPPRRRTAKAISHAKLESLVAAWPGTDLINGLRRWRATAEAVLTGIQTAQSGVSAEGLRSLVAATESLNGQGESIRHRLLVDLELGRSADADRHEEGLVRSRAAQMRFLIQAGPALASLRSAAAKADLDVGDALAGLEASTRGLVAALGALEQRLHGTGTQRDQIPLLEDLMRLRGLRALARSPQKPTREEVLAIDAHAVATLVSGWESRLADLEALVTAEDAAFSAEHLGRAVDTLSILAAAFAEPEAVAFQADVQRLRQLLPAAEARQRHDLREIALGLVRRLRALAADGRHPLAFSGGPAIPDHPSMRADLGATRRRLAALFHHAQVAVLEGLLISSPFDAAAAWADLSYRLALCDLAGPAAARVNASESRGGERLRTWLQQQIEAGKRESGRAGAMPRYGAATREYLDAIADFLRY